MGEQHSTTPSEAWASGNSGWRVIRTDPAELLAGNARLAAKDALTRARIALIQEHGEFPPTEVSRSSLAWALQRIDAGMEAAALA
eukprot:5374548-Heterocapsa_arctica.AAC.1